MALQLTRAASSIGSFMLYEGAVLPNAARQLSLSLGAKNIIEKGMGY